MMDRTPEGPCGLQGPPREPTKSDIEAVDWLIKLTEIASDAPDLGAALKDIQDEFNVWATRSPANLHSLFETVSVFEALGECEAEMLRELVSHSDSSGNVASLIRASNRFAAADSSANPLRVKKWGGPSWLKRALTAAAGVVTIGVGAFVWHWAQGTTYTTIAGEWRRIPLADGSVVFLNERSEIRVSFSSAERRITLVRGHAQFDIKHDASRPLWVDSGTLQIRDLGTAFDVDRRYGPTQVAVVEGSVSVHRMAETSRPWIGLSEGASSNTPQPRDQTLTLNEGQSAQVKGQELVAEHTDVDSIDAWRGAGLVLNRKPLFAVAELFNRDHRKQLKITDSAVRQIRISGTYQADHPEGFLQALLKVHPELRVQQTDDGWVVEETNAAKGATGG